MHSTIEETPQLGTLSSVNARQSGLYRTNTFPRSRKRLWRRSVSDGEAAIAKHSALAVAETSSSKDHHKTFRRGFSEQFQRFGRETLVRLGKLNRVRRLTGKSGREGWNNRC